MWWEHQLKCQYWPDTPNNSLNVSKSIQECMKMCVRKMASSPALLQHEDVLPETWCKVWPINLTSSWKTTRRVGKISICCAPTLPPLVISTDHSKRMISYNGCFLRDVNEGERKGRKLWEMEGEGGFCLDISHGGYRKRPDAVHHKWKLENRLPYLSNEEVNGWGVGGKWGKAKPVTIPYPKDLIPKESRLSMARKPVYRLNINAPRAIQRVKVDKKSMQYHVNKLSDYL